MADQTDTEAEGFPASIMALLALLTSAGGGSITFSFYPGITSVDELKPRQPGEAPVDAKLEVGPLEKISGLAGADMAGERRDEAEDERPARDAFDNAAAAASIARFALDQSVVAWYRDEVVVGVVTGIQHYLTREPAYHIDVPAQSGHPARTLWRDEGELCSIAA